MLFIVIPTPVIVRFNPHFSPCPLSYASAKLLRLTAEYFLKLRKV
ncbi:hypothetical protein UUU_13640 [Klebsiella pneumoniae subsp. pneumoniae DSM 30104 = JCM 1662 = NBRC 14940]|nr:hypothetical protein UUU_13640 [Klebsiella pneumoniae subsp. pneumoniae DSM 30104 = JCM 1662 = NBRC 14940]